MKQDVGKDNVSTKICKLSLKIFYHFLSARELDLELP